MTEKTLEEKDIIELGFASNGEFTRMVCAVDISTPEKRQRLRKWQTQDGTREGLERVIEQNRVAK